MAFTKTPTITATYTQTPTVTPTTSITPAIIVKPPLHSLALDTNNIQKIKNLATMGAPGESCYRYSEIGGTIQTRLRNEKTQYLLASKHLGKNKIEIWDLEERTMLQSFSSVDIDNILFHPDQNSFISSVRNEKLTLKLWNIESKNEQFSFLLEGGYIGNRIIVSPDGFKVAFFSGQGGGLGLRISELYLQTNQVKNSYYDFPLYYETLPPYLYSPQGNLIAVTYSTDEKLHLSVRSF